MTAPDRMEAAVAAFISGDTSPEGYIRERLQRAIAAYLAATEGVGEIAEIRQQMFRALGSDADHETLRILYEKLTAAFDSHITALQAQLEATQKELGECQVGFETGKRIEASLQAALGERERECERYEAALKDVCNPFGRYKREAEAKGMVLNAMARQITDDVEYIKDIARAALSQKEAKDK